MSQLKACLFDLDGVVVDTAQFHYAAWKSLANQLGFDLTPEQNEQLKGVSRMESLDIILEIGNVKLDEGTKQRMAAEKNQHYLELCQQMTPEDVLPGVRDFMDQLVAASIKIGLGSASKNARLILAHINMLDRFATIVDGTRITKGKPDPETFLLGAQDLGVEPTDCVVFEDAVAGIQAAKNGGMVAVGVGDPAVLAGSNLVITGFEDLSLATIQYLFE
ncbi:beta-phosphoglucomutase [Salmonirosea aquatica]|uniref:Beta-phosphoglucomutase n=1 Tax=Salmonirosea aquatica TaxID=2654236 RepID=A0A7C9BFK9_9BACT|nr:beta-phosphoglucomutase [Cytophagaceae bacterium SJW1-29]